MSTVTNNRTAIAGALAAAAAVSSSPVAADGFYYSFGHEEGELTQSFGLQADTPEKSFNSLGGSHCKGVIDLDRELNHGDTRVELLAECHSPNRLVFGQAGFHEDISENGHNPDQVFRLGAQGKFIRVFAEAIMNGDTDPEYNVGITARFFLFPRSTTNFGHDTLDLER